MSETDTQVRLRRAKDTLTVARAKEEDARKLLQLAREATEKAKARYELLFMQEDREEYSRRMASYRRN